MTLQDLKENDIDSPFLSVIVPVFNEGEILASSKNYIENFIDRLVHPSIELVFVDGGSLDNTVDTLKKRGLNVVNGPLGRARQMNYGASLAQGRYLLFLHIDTVLNISAGSFLDFLSTKSWGFFKVRLSNPSFIYRVISRGINFRSSLFKVATGDQGIFVKRELFEESKGYQDIVLMEDIELSRRLKATSMPAILSHKICVSSRKWEQRGPIKLTFLMWTIQLAFKLGVSPVRLASWYR